MSNQEGGGGGLFGAYAPISPPLGPSVLSPNPYLNFDPALIQPTPESQFIFPEGANHRRGRFELAFQTIGASVLAGGLFGGANGLYSGVIETKELAGSVKRTQVLNFITKSGASSAQTLGTIGLMYSCFGILLSKGRGAEDELNTLVAGTCTGLLYKAPAGWQKSLRGGALGLSVAIAYCLITSRDRLKQIMGVH